MQNVSRALRRDPTGMPILGGSIVSGILNFSVTASGFTTIKLPIGVSCKALIMKLRTGSSWIAKRVGENTYFTVSGFLSLDLTLKGGENIFQVKTSSGSDVMEVMLLD